MKRIHRLKNKAVILLSGGLDSVVSLALAAEKYEISMALTFDYGQKALEKELRASENICNYYNISHRIINLDWLEIITQTSLVSNLQIPVLEAAELNNFDKMSSSSQSVWVPNRNGLFINIAASFADSFELDYIVIGANKEEGATFKDNSKDFIQAVNFSLENSTNYKVQVLAPLIDYDKNEIVKIALEKQVPMQFIRSCYLDGDKQCGECESCMRLKRALIANNHQDLLNSLF